MNEEYWVTRQFDWLLENFRILPFENTKKRIKRWSKRIEYLHTSFIFYIVKQDFHFLRNTFALAPNQFAHACFIKQTCICCDFLCLYNTHINVLIISWNGFCASCDCWYCFYLYIWSNALKPLINSIFHELKQLLSFFNIKKTSHPVLCLFKIAKFKN